MSKKHYRVEIRLYKQEDFGNDLLIYSVNSEVDYFETEHTRLYDWLCWHAKEPKSLSRDVKK